MLLGLHVFETRTSLVRVVVDFGYDLHAIYISETTFSQIQAGQPLVVEGQGFPVEGVREEDRWMFNNRALGAIYVSTDEGREVFEGYLGDAEVDVREE